MKKLVPTLLATACALATSAAFAAPVALPQGPIFIQYTNAEQFSATNSIPNPGAVGSSGNWGIVQLTTIVAGTALAPLGSDIQGGGTPAFVDQVLPAGAQILGIFYGIQNVGFAGGSFQSSGGRIDLYYWEPGHAIQNSGIELSSGANLAKRTAVDEYTGFTCASGNTAQCTFLFSATFESGALPGAPGITVSSPQTPGSADGTSKSYLSVDTSDPGAWTSILNQNFFTLDPCNNPVGHNYAPAEVCPTTGIAITTPGGVSFTAAQDFRLDNNFSRNGATAWDVAGTNIIGLRSNDPARAFVPEPGVLGLLGVALLGLAGFRRRARA